MRRFGYVCTLGAAAAALALTPVACSRSGNPAVPSGAIESASVQEGRGGPARSAKPLQLNLSHIECIDEDTVEVHFVLLFVPDGVTPPATLDFTYDGGNGTANRRDPKTGNVWHYSALLPSPVTIENLNASIMVNGETVPLHNPGAYSGTYDCSEVEICATAPPAQDLVCLPPPPPGSPDAECAFFAPGSVSIGQDDPVTVPHSATQDAAFAVVKTGVGTTGCTPPNNAYRIVPNVSDGDPLLPPGSGNDISHVTYCSCPPPAPAE